MISLLLESTLIGIQTGSQYALVALGLSLIFGVVRIVNFAQGTMMMLSMYLGYYLWYFAGLDPYLSVVLVAPIAFAFGYATQYLLVRPLFLREKSYVVEPLSVLILMAGVDLILTNLGILVFDPYVKTVSTAAGTTSLQIGEITVNLARMLTVPVVVLLAFALNQFLYRTDYGNVIRAVGQSREAAAICGVDVHKAYAVAFGVGLTVTAIGGAAILPFTPISPTMGINLGIKAFIVVVMGGLGSIWGVVVAGIILGLVEAWSSIFVPMAYSNVIALVLFIAVIVVKPTGLMGRIRV